MNKSVSCTPDIATGNTTAIADTLPPFGDKRDVCRLAGMKSVRWVSNEMNRGLPFMRLGLRRVRFDLPTVRAWLLERYGVQQRKAKP